ncbi:Sodium/hydrogen exchanger family-domain-containing protein [Gymnopilus junonius]|uniref:Sodium/hydrogen exchanger family-domain-containing protein n=1 Tax=Gymnopilus junonius TaxID=109634 RepID=A0A9P5NH64_GYMJU|nr:Sodium/hydrogen exchanger family-domain-containing protein [Gymnopilus junonius]
MGEFSTQIDKNQGGVIAGDNPSVYNASDPFQLWVIQLVIIMAMIQLLSIPLSRMRQPRVISEILAGVVLGPTAMGRIPHFTQSIFPTASIPILTLTSTIGLVLFLFLVGLEIDTRVMKRNVMSSVSVSVAGLIIPLGLGAALVCRSQRQFGHFLLFVAVAVGITAFPVLCRILTELKLLDTEVGLVTLSAGVGNDVIGWILLALAVALVNASSGLTAAGFTIFLLYPGRWAIRWLAKRTGSLEQGSPTMFMMTIILFTIYISAFYTDIIGVHPIFGGFLAGLIIPHDNGFAISIVEKLEDLVCIIFLPLYFVISGLKTDLGLLNTGVIWAARLNGYSWRESGAIGALMSCKGLVELIVLNIGLQAGVLTPTTFAMFVIHALILTFTTTPLVILFYPAKYRIHDMGGKKEGDESSPSSSPPPDGNKTRFAIVLDKMEALPPAMTLSQLLHTPAPSFSITIEALRLMELTSRTSAVLRSQEAESLVYNDPVVSVYRTFCQLNNFKVYANLSVVNFDEFPETIANHALETKSQMVIIPWPTGATTICPNLDPCLHTSTRNPFDGVFHRTASQDQTTSFVYSEYIRKVFASSPADTALFVDRDSTCSFILWGTGRRLALSFLVQLCERPSVTATVVRLSKIDPSLTSPPPAVLASSQHNTIAAVDTVYGQYNTQIRLASDTADNILWDRYTRSTEPHPSNVSSALPRISFLTESTATPLRRVIEMVKEEAAICQADPFHSKTLIVVAGRSRRMAVESLSAELRTLTSDGPTISSSVSKTLGDVGAALVAAGVDASLLILQASPSDNA